MTSQSDSLPEHECEYQLGWHGDRSCPTCGTLEPVRAIAGHWERDEYGYWFIPDAPDA